MNVFKYKSSLVLIIVLTVGIYQNLLANSCLSGSRRVDWPQAGLLPSSELTIDHWICVDNYSGADHDKILSAINDANGQIGNTVIYFESALYTISSTIKITPAEKNKDGSIIFLGNLSPDTLSILSFDNIPVDDNCFSIQGNWQGDTIHIQKDIEKGDSIIICQTDISIIENDWIRIFESGFDDNFDEESDYIGQVTRVKSIDANELLIKDEASKDYFKANNLYLQEIEPVTNIGFENLKIQRNNESKGYGVTINFEKAVNCWLKGVESYNCTGYHIRTSNSSHIDVSGCYIHKATNYDSNEGTGYGVVLGNASTNCLVENNIFCKTRHAMLVGTGANANVFVYNYSREAQWDEEYENLGLNPGDIRLHGRYPYGNLFEGNSVDFIFGDPTHGDNGPYNTFFRNKVREDNITLFNSDYSNILTNLIENGSVDLSPNYLELLVWPDAEESTECLLDDDCSDLSFYYSDIPSYFDNNVTFPPIEANMELELIPAESRWVNGDTIYYNPFYFSPVLKNPIEDIEINEDSAPVYVKLDNVFQYPLDHNALIQYRLIHISNEALLTGDIANDSLVITPITNQNGVAEMIVQGEYNGLTAVDSFTVFISPENDLPTEFSLFVPANNDTIELLDLDSVQFSWHQSVDVDFEEEVHYDFIIDDSIFFTSLHDTNLFIAAEIFNQLFPVSGKEINLFWLVRAISNNDTVECTTGYSLNLIDSDVGIDDGDVLSYEFMLNQNYPNPFNPVTTIVYSISNDTNVKLQVFDLRGKLIETLVEDFQNYGYYTIKWNAADNASGLYFYRLTTDETNLLKKCLLLK